MIKFVVSSLKLTTLITIMQRTIQISASFYFSYSLYSKLTLGVGVYAGMYIAQNFEVPKVDEPEKIFEKLSKLFEDAKKKTDK